MNRLLDRLRIIATAAPTWLTAASTVLLIIHSEIAGLLPAGVAERLGSIVLVAVAWLGAAVAIIRRVTPVPVEQRGVLPARRRRPLRVR